MPIEIAIMQTGHIRTRPSQLTQLPRNVLLGRLGFIFDRSWADPIPLYPFQIRHRKGDFLFDLGETPCSIEPKYYNR